MKSTTSAITAESFTHPGENVSTTLPFRYDIRTTPFCRPPPLEAPQWSVGLLPGVQNSRFGHTGRIDQSKAMKILSTHECIILFGWAVFHT
ncbi:MAG: hypothetical protein ACE5OZ_04350 [Candidatus Heimdallarchaeota archaeon]